MLRNLRQGVRSLWNGEDGAVGWLIVGILVGAALIVFGIIKFLIPGE